MSSTVFFEGERVSFFRPLTGARRELVVSCLRSLYERLHGPAADYAHNLTRDALKELIFPVVRDHLANAVIEEDSEELGSTEANDPHQITATLIRSLLGDGWLEQFADRHGLTTAFRLSRAGKVFAEAIWTLDRPSRSRQRNMRGCRNALEAALSSRGDAHDLVDAYEYAERVIEDLTDGTAYFQELTRNLMQGASAHTHWGDFVEFLDRFNRDYSKQLTADNAALNRQSIRQNIEKLRMVPDAKFKRINEQLHDVAHWATKEREEDSIYDWFLQRVEDIVDVACETKLPGFLKAMEVYLKRINGLALQSMMLRSGQNRHAYLTAINRVAESTRETQDALLARIGEKIAPAEIRLLDPSSFKLRTASQRKKSVTVSTRPRASREERLAAFMDRAEAEAFSMPHEVVAQALRADLRLFRHPIRISTLATNSAQGALLALTAVEAARSAAGADLEVRRLPYRMSNDIYSGNDYEISLKS